MKPTRRNLAFLFHQSNLIEGFDDPEFDEQLKVAWDWIERIPLKDLYLSDVTKLQKIATLRQDDLEPNQRGWLRGHGGNNVNVMVGGYKAPPYDRVPDLMRDWLIDLADGKYSPVEAHIEFERIHPFVDGNGRTGRLILWWHEKWLGQDLTKITYEDRVTYYRWFA